MANHWQRRSLLPSLNRRLWLILGIIGGSIALLVVGTTIMTMILNQTLAPSSRSQPIHTVTSVLTHQSASAPPASPTPKPSATVGPFGVTHGLPHLGGPLSDFIGAYGQPNSDSVPPLYHFLHATGSNVDGLVVSVAVGTQTVDLIAVQATNGDSPTDVIGWTASEAESRCQSLEPSDAHLKQRMMFADGTGYDDIYFSTSLAHLIPADDFLDSNGQAVSPGTFDVAYLYANDWHHIGSCSLMTGAQQTQD